MTFELSHRILRGTRGTVLALALLILAAPLFAQNLAVELTLDRTTIVSGEQFELQAVVTGYELTSRVDLIFTDGGGGFYSSFGRLESYSGAGWACRYPESGGEAIACTFQRASTATVVPALRLRLGAPIFAFTQHAPMALTAHVTGWTGDAGLPGRTAEARFTVVPRAERADVRITSPHQYQRVDQSSTARIVFAVSNFGPDPTGELRVIATSVPILDHFFTRRGFRVVSTGWRCEVKGETLDCATSSLLPGETRNLEFEFVAASSVGELGVTLRAFPTGAGDPNVFDNGAHRTIIVLSDERVESVLFPIASFRAAGALGSSWSSEAIVSSTLLRPATFFPQSYHCNILCPPTPALGYPIEPLRPVRIGFIDDGPQGPPGRVMYGFAEELPSLHFQHRIYDESRSSTNYGTELPVIREDELTTVAMDLLNIPSSDRFRSTLRIYDPENEPGGRVRLRFYSMTDQLLHEMEAALQKADPIGYQELDLPSRPAYLQIDALSALHPQLTATSRFRIEIVPLTPGLRYWAFVSVTNNETQHVTTVTPQ